MITLHTVSQRDLLLLQLTNNNVAQVVIRLTLSFEKIFGILEQTWRQENNQVSRFCHSLKTSRK